MDDEPKSRDLEIASDPHPIEMWTGPLETKTDSTAGTTLPEIEEGMAGGSSPISTIRIVALTIIMIFTYFLGVSFGTVSGV